MKAGNTKTRRHKDTKFFVSRKERKGAKRQMQETRRHEGVETQEDTKFYFNTKLLNNGKYFQLPPWGIEGANLL
jgi:hypothetical protein